MAVGMTIGGHDVELRFGPISDEEVEYLVTEWQPLSAGHADEDWNWREICGTQHGPCLKLYAGGFFIGILMFAPDRSNMSSELDGSQGVLIDWLAGAPWCRSGAAKDDRPRVGGLGLAIMSIAVAASKALGCEGRLCFFSEEKSAEWYHGKLKGLEYFGLRYDGERSLPISSGRPRRRRPTLSPMAFRTYRVYCEACLANISSMTCPSSSGRALPAVRVRSSITAVQRADSRSNSDGGMPKNRRAALSYASPGRKRWRSPTTRRLAVSGPTSSKA